MNDLCVFHRSRLTVINKNCICLKITSNEKQFTDLFSFFLLELNMSQNRRTGQNCCSDLYSSFFFSRKENNS